MSDTFTARYPDGRTVRLRVKRDIDKLADLDPLEQLPAMLKMFPSPKRCGRSFNEVMAEAMAKGDHDDDGSGDRENGDRNDGGGASDHPVTQLARLLVASGKFSD